MKQLLASVIAAAVCGLRDRNTAVEPADAPNETPNEVIEDVTSPEPEPEPESEPEPELTVSQENAIQTAKDYLSFSAFSESGLIDQLKFEGYPARDAKFAVNYISVNWKEQAAKMAKSYLDTGSFSRQGLIDQLEFEGFTTAQATYGVNKTGL